MAFRNLMDIIDEMFKRGKFSKKLNENANKVMYEEEKQKYETIKCFSKFIIKALKEQDVLSRMWEASSTGEFNYFTVVTLNESEDIKQEHTSKIELRDGSYINTIHYNKLIGTGVKIQKVIDCYDNEIEIIQDILFNEFKVKAFINMRRPSNFNKRYKIDIQFNWS